MEVTIDEVGDFRVTVQRKRRTSGTSNVLPTLVTIHDIGSNRECYMEFLEREYNKQVGATITSKCLGFVK